MIDPDAIPQFTGNVDQLEADIADLKGDGTAVEKTGTDTNAAFQGLSAYYQAPEAEQLFATTKPVATAGTTFRSDLTRVTGALSSYATEIRPIAAKLADLKDQAHTFVKSVSGDKDWQYDGGKVDRDNQLRTEVDAAVAAFWDAERRCANAIEAVFGGTRFTANDGSNKSTMYGYTAKQLDGAKGLPWGDPVEQKYHWYDIGHWTWSFIKGFVVDGLWGTIKGIGGLVGFEGWNTLVNSWKGLGELGIGLASYQFLPPLGPGEKDLPGWLRDSRRTTVAAGKAMIGWDEWSKDPARAAGGVVFNVLTVVAGGGEADGVEAAGDAGKASAAARAMGALSKAGRFVDPMTYVGKGAGFAFGNLAKIPKVSIALDGLSKAKAVTVTRLGDHLTNLRTHLSGGDPHLPAGEPSGTLVAGPDGTIHLPDGSRLTPDGHYHLPDGTTATVPSDELAHGIHLPTSDPAHELVGAHAGPGGLTHTAGGADDHTSRGELGTHPSGHASATGDRGGASVTHIGDGGPGHGGTGGMGGHGGGGGDDTPPPHEGADGTHRSGDDDLHHALGKGPEARTAEERKVVMDHQVHRANTDPKYFREHYKSNGNRKDLEHTDPETGTTPPQLMKPGGGRTWISVHDAPEPLPPKFHDDRPVVGFRDDLSGHAAHTLDRAAHSRHEAIVKDKAAETKLGDAKKAYEAHPTPAHHQAFQDAKTEHTPLHRDMAKLSENYGEAIAKHHVIPGHYEGAVQETLHGPANGNDQFDQVWRTKDGHYVVVEAKSSLTTKLGARNLADGVRVSQGTRPYFDDILKQMQDRGEDHPSEAALAKNLKAALAQGKVEYILVKGNENAGRYAGYSMWKFDID
ncbi:hypothetical protein [Streptantibioticus silvisoli]|uniref:Tox-REase-7 domain-containing protein n=1 Tax=Streptantibioticus silvisoli TaxID=2705255 RepID=A0ABT6W455_9ACTN|nr:hypothetical protein [Streptantibioticus silvisoli]MDI5965542.1 hypothetical protein [Streptantibioticus silvisoli]